MSLTPSPVLHPCTTLYLSLHVVTAPLTRAPSLHHTLPVWLHVVTAPLTRAPSLHHTLFVWLHVVTAPLTRAPSLHHTLSGCMWSLPPSPVLHPCTTLLSVWLHVVTAPLTRAPSLQARQSAAEVVFRLPLTSSGAFPRWAQAGLAQGLGPRIGGLGFRCCDLGHVVG